jgi:hypothetical protein
MSSLKTLMASSANIKEDNPHFVKYILKKMREHGSADQKYAEKHVNLQNKKIRNTVFYSKFASVVVEEDSVEIYLSGLLGKPNYEYQYANFHLPQLLSMTQSKNYSNDYVRLTEALVLKMKAAYPHKKMILIGHSAGGKVAEYVSQKFHVPAITFAIFNPVQDNITGNVPVRHYFSQYDPFSRGQKTTGSSIVVEEMKTQGTASLPPFSQTFNAPLETKFMGQNFDISPFSPLQEVVLDVMNAGLKVYMGEKPFDVKMTATKLVFTDLNTGRSTISSFKLLSSLFGNSLAYALGPGSNTTIAEKFTSIMESAVETLTSKQFYTSIVESAGTVGLALLGDMAISNLLTTYYKNENEKLQKEEARAVQDMQKRAEAQIEKLLSEVEAQVSKHPFIGMANDFFQISEATSGKFLNHNGEMVSLHALDLLVEENDISSFHSFRIPAGLYYSSPDKPTNYSGAANFFFNFPSKETSPYARLVYKDMVFIYLVFRYMHQHPLSSSIYTSPSPLQEKVYEKIKALVALQKVVDEEKNENFEGSWKRFWHTMEAGMSDKEYDDDNIEHHYDTRLQDAYLGVEKAYIAYINSTYRDSKISYDSATSFQNEVQYLFKSHSFPSTGSDMPVMMQETGPKDITGRTIMIRYHPCHHSRFKAMNFQNVGHSTFAALAQNFKDMERNHGKKLSYPWKIDRTESFKKAVTYLLTESYKQHPPLSREDNAKAILFTTIVKFITKMAVLMNIDAKKLYVSFFTKKESMKNLTALYTLLLKSNLPSVDTAFFERRQVHLKNVTPPFKTSQDAYNQTIFH